MNEKKTILLIEDNDEMRENTSEILELAKYNVITAKNGKIGVELAQKEKPNLIICDIMMPVLDGYGVLHMLGKNPETSAIPFIFLTAKAEKTDFRKGMSMGADDYITKPFDDIELLNAVENRLRKSESIKKNYSEGYAGASDFFNDVKGLEELQKLTDHTDDIHVKKKETIYKEGSFPKGIYLIKKGKIKTYKTNEFGKELITGLYNEGDFFGYSSLLEEQKYEETAATLEDSDILLIPKDDFFDLLYKNIAVARQFIKLLSNNIKDREEQLIKLAYNSVRKRVAESLLNLSKRYNTTNSKQFSMNISREDLANLAGTSTETAIRTLSDFKEEGFIEISGGKITIVDHDKLSKLKN